MCQTERQTDRHAHAELKLEVPSTLDSGDKEHLDQTVLSMYNIGSENKDHLQIKTKFSCPRVV